MKVYACCCDNCILHDWTGVFAQFPPDDWVDDDSKIAMVVWDDEGAQP